MSAWSAELLRTAGRMLGTAGAAAVADHQARAAAAPVKGRKRRKRGGGCTPCEAAARAEAAREAASEGRLV